MPHLSSVSAHMVAVLAASLYLPAAFSAEPLEIKASLSGYNLLWPTSRCCAFNLVLAANGKGTVTVHDNRGNMPREKTVALDLTADEMQTLRLVVSSNAYFSLPKVVGDVPVHGDVRRMDIRIGTQTRTVELDGWPATPQVLDSYDTEKRRQIDRAAAVWTAIRRLVGSSEIALP